MKRKHFTILLFLLINSILFATQMYAFEPVIEPPQSEIPKGWKYKGGDEFNGTMLDKTKWGIYGNTKLGGFGDGAYMQYKEHLLSTYYPNNVKIQTLPTGESVCNLVSTKGGGAPHPTWTIDGKNVVQLDQPGWYTGGVSSRDANTYYPLYSRIEIKAKSSYVFGFWPALWCRFNGGASIAELDILEFFVKEDGGTQANAGTPKVRHSSHFHNYDFSLKKIVPISGDPDTKFHVYAVQIDKDQIDPTQHAIITYWVDGVETNRISTRDIKGWNANDNFIKTAHDKGLLNNAWDIALTNKVGGYEAWISYPASNITSHELTIDWVRVYTASTEPPVVPTKEVYLIGGATPKGWDNVNPAPMKYENGKYTWSGYLKASDFKFITTLKSWNPAIYARFANEPIIPGYTHNVVSAATSSTDYKFVIHEAGDYTIVLDVDNKTMLVNKQNGNSPIYLVGGAAPCGWDNTKAIRLNADSSQKYVWKGYLRADQFKFITKLGTWNSLVPTKAANESVTLNQTHNISNYYQGDFRFTIAEAGNYVITVDLQKRTMVVQKAPPVETVYIVGDATNTGWDNTKAQPLILEYETFRWQGELKPGQFKFITELGTWNSIKPARSANEIVIPSYAHDVCNDCTSGDYKFVIDYPGTYYISLDLETNTMIIGYSGSGPDYDRGSGFFIVGDATPSGWSNTNGSQQMYQIHKYSQSVGWSGNLKKGTFKIITRLGTWNSIKPNRTSNENIILEYSHEVCNDCVSADSKFVITRDDYYRVNLNPINHTLEAFPVQFSPTDTTNMQNIYIVGDATPIGWDNRKAQPLTRFVEFEETDYATKYNWSGYLKAGQFKFITDLGTWNSLVPTKAANEVVVLGNKQAITNLYQGDYRFVINEPGDYLVTVDITNRTLVVQKNAPAFSMSSLDQNMSQNRLFTILSNIGSVDIVFNDAVMVDRAELVNTSGLIVAKSEKKNASFTLGNQIVAGTYIVKITYNNQLFTQRVMIK